MYEQEKVGSKLYQISEIDLNFTRRRQTLIGEKNKQKYNKQRFKDYSSYFNNKNLWLIKPTSYNRGRGIRIFDNIKVLHTFIAEYFYGVKESMTFPS